MLHVTLKGRELISYFLGCVGGSSSLLFPAWNRQHDLLSLDSLLEFVGDATLWTTHSLLAGGSAGQTQQKKHSLCNQSERLHVVLIGYVIRALVFERLPKYISSGVMRLVVEAKSANFTLQQLPNLASVVAFQP